MKILLFFLGGSLNRGCEAIVRTAVSEIKKGRFVKFSENLPCLKTGELSIIMCIDFDIQLAEDEFEAILYLDKKDDEQSKYFANTSSKILKMANEFAEIERKNNFILSKKI